MMEPKVSPEEKEALLGAEAGEPPAGSAPPFSLRNPAPLSVRERGQLSRPLAMFVDELASGLNGRFECPAQVQVEAPQVDRADAALAAQAERSCFQRHSSPFGTVTVVWHPALREALVDRLLGGAGGNSPPSEPATMIEIEVLSELGSEVVHALGAFLSPGVKGSFTSEPATSESVEAAPAVDDEPVVTVSLQVSLSGTSETAALMVSKSCLQRLGVLSSSQDEGGSASMPMERLRAIKLDVVADLRGVTLALEDLVRLKPGDEIAVDVEPDAALTLSINKVPVWNATLRQHRGERLVEITGPVGR